MEEGGGLGLLHWAGIALIGVAIFCITYYFIALRSTTMPIITGFRDKKEGFVSTQTPDCIRSSSEAEELYAMFANRNAQIKTEDKEEFFELLSHITCLKSDLLATAGLVAKTRERPFLTHLDLEPLAETTARCMAKTIPKRDIELSLSKWSKRGHLLITHLCTVFDMQEHEVVRAESLFESLMRDILSVTTEKCFNGPAIIAELPQVREPHPYVPASLQERADYNGYF